MAVTALACVGASAYFYATDLPVSKASPQPQFAVAPEKVELTDAQVGDTIVRLAFTNADSRRDAVILGCASQCDLNCCYRPASEDRVPIAASATAMFEVKLTIHKNGPFSAGIVVFADEGVLRTYLIPVSGIATAHAPK